MPASETRFKPLWIDQPNALEHLQQLKDHNQVGSTLADRLAHLIEHGWVILPGAITADLADQLRQEIDDVVSRPEYFIARRVRKAYDHPSREIYDDPTFRLIDYHINSRLARQAIFSPAIGDVLNACFNEAANAFQCLTFNYGSQQAMHQDGAYVVVAEPLQFLASWIALEDVTEGSGELAYYSGSHKLDDFLFGGNSKCWLPAIHGQEAHREFLDTLDERCQSNNMPRMSFLPKKGDALIWASDLVHGGLKRKNDNTRQSIVTHYCPLSVPPNFSKFTKFYHPLQLDQRSALSSRHYDLRQRSRIFSPEKEPEYYKPAFMGKK